VKYLVDANVWFQGILGREFAADVASLLTSTPEGFIATTDFALHSVGIRLAPIRYEGYRQFLEDMINRRIDTLHLPASDLQEVLRLMRQHRLDFDDAFQYLAAERFNLRIISFDTDFDHTPRGRLTPSQALSEIQRLAP
jgi:predicted nucleic acid-binding protein